MIISDIAAEARSLVDADTTSYTNADLLRRLNLAYEEIAGFIIGVDGLWQWDDFRFTNFPVGTTTLVASQNDYSFDITMLEILRAEVLDSAGIWQALTPIDISQIDGAIDEFEKTDGLPRYYDKSGSSIILYPAPASGSVTLAAGLKVYFQRTASIFTSAELTTGTVIPGFVSLYHVILAYMAALPYAESYKKDRVPAIINKIEQLRRGLKEHYSRREKDRRKIMSTSGVSSR